jgi:uncharacterized protein
MHASEPEFAVDTTEQHLLRSSRVSQTFKISVFQPMRRADASEHFPVLYVTDADDFYGGLAAIARILQLLGEAPRFILVGIGYEDSRSAVVLRMRDLFPHAVRKRFHTEILDILNSPLVTGIKDPKAITDTTDAGDFLEFIREELFPFIAAKYSVLPNDNNFAGYSGGGGFGLYTLFNKPDTFRRYILGSPATSHTGHNFGIEFAQAFIQSRRTMDTNVFMSVGELEEFKKGQDQFDLVSGYYLLSKFLKRAQISGLTLSSKLFLGETHATAWTLAFTHGVKALFGAVDQVPFWPKFLK